ncbi:hypothetical protein SLS54_010378 [Diplodia seriata]
MLSQIVVGIDFGTTHSGVSWAVKTKAGGHKVRVINDWPNPHAQNATADKVPTTVSYGGDGKLDRWGYANTPGDSTLKWFKVLLEPDNKYRNAVEEVQASMKLLNSIGKPPEDLTADYLSLIWKYTKDDLRRHQGQDWEDIYALKVVLTVPAIWSAAAKEKTLRAAKAAGFPADITLVTEPEAAAIAVLKDKAAEEGLEVGDSFVVCDAGGGTVDLISYKIKSLSPLQIEESAIGDGDLCGSVFLDRAFERYIATIIGPERYRTQFSQKAKTNMMREFEYGVKRVFTGENALYTVDLKGSGDDSMNGIDDDTITLKVSMLKTIFDHVCNQVQTLVERQIDSVGEHGSKVKAVLLVGGFGSSKYLFNHISAAQKASEIRVLQSTNAWSAICRGATEWGLENADAVAVCPDRTNKTVVSRLSRYSYGVALSCLWDASIHDEHDRYFDQAEGVYRARNQMRWLLKRGQKIKDGQVLKLSLYETVDVGCRDCERLTFTRCLYICGKDIPSKRQDSSVIKFCSVSYAIPRNQLSMEKIYTGKANGKRYRDAIFNLVLKMGGAKVDFRVYYNDKLAANCEARYLKDA